MYDPAKMPAPLTSDDHAAHPFIAAHRAINPMRMVVQGFPDLEATPENIAMMRSLYFGLATEVDHHIGRVIAWLKDTGQYDDTILVVTADHGEMLGDQQAWGKSTCYDAAYHTPLMIRAPGCVPGFYKQPTESVDITPTLLDLLGLEIPSVMDGKPLTGFLTGNAPDTWRDHSYSELDFGDPITPTRMQKALGLPLEACNFCILRGPRHTLVHFNAGLPPLLFDREADGEMRNIANEPEAQSDLLSMTRALLDHRMTWRKGMFNTTMATETGIQTR
jgi:arylsulfatase A-like enzyme